MLGKAISPQVDTSHYRVHPYDFNADAHRRTFTICRKLKEKLSIRMTAEYLPHVHSDRSSSWDNYLKRSEEVKSVPTTGTETVDYIHHPMSEWIEPAEEPE